MITEKEIQATQLSATKKDFYQIWNELLDMAGKISERWDPSATNESDPGIVLLKVLTAIADKLNYNIDKNTLEAFMPSASQEESMRKLCEMMGYSIGYYKSAKTTATITYTGDNKTIGDIYIPKFAVISNSDNTVVYTTLEDVQLYVNENDVDGIRTNVYSKNVECIEGSRVKCETNETNDVITLNMIDDNNKYFLPEHQIAENGIFVYNYSESAANFINSEQWEKVDNLNTITPGKKVYKFGFDSRRNLPYIQFSNDISNIIEDGLQIYYIRTSGNAGNISARTLTTLTSADIFAGTSEDVTISNTDFSITNYSSTTTGKNIESINDAYNNYKKTIGTFDTLVTCRDYMNKIYQLIDDTSGNPLVSNIIVSDIRDDINRAITVCEFDGTGIKYVNRRKSEESTNTNSITNFDLMIYPFATIYGVNTASKYANSFTYSAENKNDIEDKLELYKTISHNYKYPVAGEITCIKNYLKLNAKITTTYKININEETSILENIYSSIYNEFNCRKLDFGEEIAFDSILTTIENADKRIKNVSLEDPTLYTAIQVINNDDVVAEYACDLELDSTEFIYNNDKYLEFKKLLNKLTLRNVLAGKIKLFNYNTNVKNGYDRAKYEGLEPEYPPKTVESKDQTHIQYIEPKCEIVTPNNTINYVTLSEGEVISFRAPNYRTKITYPAYVNYYATLPGFGENSETTRQARAANMTNLYNYFWRNGDLVLENNKVDSHGGRMMVNLDPDNPYAIEKVADSPIFEWIDDPDTSIYRFRINSAAPVNNRWYISFNNTSLSQEWWPTWFQDNLGTNKFYSKVSQLSTTAIGYLVDNTHSKYKAINAVTSANTLSSLYYPIGGTDGLGVDAVLGYIEKNTEYQLKSDEYLYINYTKAATDDNSNEEIINVRYGPGTIIKTNFDLYDTGAEISQGIQISKKDGFDFTNYGINTSDWVGMKTLGTKEQIEIRELAKVSLYDESTPSKNTALIYWTLNNSSYDQENPDRFPLKQIEGMNDKYHYILKENEYFYYTSSEKQELAYYGNGSEIITSIAEIKKTQAEDSNMSTEDILLSGLNSVPWVVISDLSLNKNIEIQEHQYFNFSEGDTVYAELYTNQDMSGSQEDATKLDSNYSLYADNIKYIQSDSFVEKTLPKIILGDAKKLVWQVASRLELNISKFKDQTLHNNYDSITLNGYKGKPEQGSEQQYIIQPETIDVESLKNYLIGSYGTSSSIVGNWRFISNDEDYMGEPEQEPEYKTALSCVIDCDATTNPKPVCLEMTRNSNEALVYYDITDFIKIEGTGKYLISADEILNSAEAGDSAQVVEKFGIFGTNSSIQSVLTNSSDDIDWVEYCKKDITDKSKKELSIELNVIRINETGSIYYMAVQKDDYTVINKSSLNQSDRLYLVIKTEVSIMNEDSSGEGSLVWLSNPKLSRYKDKQVTINSNYQIQSADNNISTSVTRYESDMKTVKEHIDDFSIYTYSYDPVYAITEKISNNLVPEDVSEFGVDPGDAPDEEVGKFYYIDDNTQPQMTAKSVDNKKLCITYNGDATEAIDEAWASPGWAIGSYIKDFVTKNVLNEYEIKISLDVSCDDVGNSISVAPVIRNYGYVGTGANKWIVYKNLLGDSGEREEINAGGKTLSYTITLSRDEILKESNELYVFCFHHISDSGLGSAEPTLSANRILYFSNVEAKISAPTKKGITLNNFGKNGAWTNLQLADFVDTETENTTISLNTNIPNNNFGLMMLYYKNNNTNSQENTSLENRPYITTNNLWVKAYNYDYPDNYYESKNTEKYKFIGVGLDETFIESPSEEPEKYRYFYKIFEVYLGEEDEHAVTKKFVVITNKEKIDADNDDFKQIDSDFGDVAAIKLKTDSDYNFYYNNTSIYSTQLSSTLHNNEYFWWKDHSQHNDETNQERLYLRDGINIIKLEVIDRFNILDGVNNRLSPYAEPVLKSCDPTITIHLNNTNKNNTSSVIFSNLDYIYDTNYVNETHTEATNGINIKNINYQWTDLLHPTAIEEKTSTRAEQLLADIRKIDPEYKFYYNLIMDNSNALDLNDNIDSDSLTDPKLLYDYNNVNNKFVISEISDADMKKGITIARSSKL